MTIKNIKIIRPIIIITLIIAACTFWIVRVELKAASLLSRVEEYHKKLNQHNDELTGLKYFSRSIGGNLIGMSTNEIKLETNKVLFSLGNNNVWLTGDVKINLKTGQTELILSDTKMNLETKGNTPLKLNTPTSNLAFKNDGVSLNSDKRLDLRVGTLFSSSLKITPSEIVLSMWGSGTKITLQKNGQIYVEAEYDLNFLAKRDINLIADKGNINLFGKKINLNK